MKEGVCSVSYFTTEALSFFVNREGVSSYLYRGELLFGNIGFIIELTPRWKPVSLLDPFRR